ncbi:hypothetical protein WICPIJ_000903 [Wickerhamomyces pijperi]|uniref:tRNA wybutosine-synthesizing protein 3 n=1 Tax=Wickerhamomyces pijperi TaxID=599730 RepID=A0A9P8QCP4_WICPI|nr:hypothetical protein WICPIJ_000903 [Wickerhamomyces pijperi]
MDPFDQKKKSIVDEIESTLGDIKDASPKGSIDELCIPIIRLINSHQDLVTTSSCSGRVSVFLEGNKVRSNTTESDLTDKMDVKIGGKGDGGNWLFVTHDKNQLTNWWKDYQFNFNRQPSDELPLSTRYILFKFEPLILHIKCRDFKSASLVYQTAMNCGFRESGIGVNNIVAIRISIKLDIPIGYLNENEQHDLFISEEYLRLVTNLSLDRFNENEKKLAQLHKAFDVNIINKVEEKEEKVWESKQERAERMKREGLEKRRLKQLQEEEKLKQLAEQMEIDNKPDQ